MVVSRLARPEYLFVRGDEMKLHSRFARYYSHAWHYEARVSDSQVWYNVGRVIAELCRRVARFLHCIK